MIGPLLFIIYIIDISTKTIHSDINLPADDAKISGKSNGALQFSSNSIYQWLKPRKLKLSPNSCKILNIHKSESNLFTKLPSVTTFKNLRIYISENVK